MPSPIFLVKTSIAAPYPLNRVGENQKKPPKPKAPAADMKAWRILG